MRPSARATRAAPPPPPKSLSERLRREVKQNVAKAGLGAVLLAVLLFMWGRLIFGEKEASAASVRPRPVAASTAAATAPAPAAMPALPAPPAAAVAGRASAAPAPAQAKTRTGSEVAAALERLAMRVRPVAVSRPARPIDRDPLDPRFDVIVAKPAAAPAPPPPVPQVRLSATVPELGCAIVDGRPYRVGQRVQGFAIAEVGAGYVLLETIAESGERITARLDVWREVHDIARPAPPAAPGAARKPHAQ